MKPECCFADVDCGKMPASLHEDIWTLEPDTRLLLGRG